MNALVDYADRLTVEFLGLIPVGNIESVYLEPIIREAIKLTWAGASANAATQALSHRTRMNLEAELARRSAVTSGPLVLTSALRSILLGSIPE